MTVVSCKVQSMKRIHLNIDTVPVVLVVAFIFRVVAMFSVMTVVICGALDVATSSKCYAKYTSYIHISIRYYVGVT